MLRGLRDAALCLLCALSVALGCSRPAPRVLVPPRVDLAEWGRIGMLEFAGPEPTLSRLATRQFMEMLQAAQPGVPILELGSAGRVLAELGRSQLDFEAIRAIGARYGVDAVFAGDLAVGPPKPSVRVGRALESLKARADVSGELAARLLETRSGATVWSGSSTGTASVASLGVAEGAFPSFGASDPSQVHAGLVARLVSDLGPDFYASWQAQ